MMPTTLIGYWHHPVVRSYRLTTCYGLHQKTSSVSIRPHSSAHSGDSSTQRPTLPSRPSIRSFTWQGLETSSWSSSRLLDRPTKQRHWICSCQPLETDRPSYGAMVERRDGPSWLRDDDEDDHDVVCVSVCLSVTLCIVALRVGIQG